MMAYGLPKLFLETNGFRIAPALAYFVSLFDGNLAAKLCRAPRLNKVYDLKLFPVKP